MAVEGEVLLITLALGNPVGLRPVAGGVLGHQEAETPGGHVTVDADIPVALPVGGYPFVSGADRSMGKGLCRLFQEGEPADVLHLHVLEQVDIFREAEGEEREAQRAVRCLETFDPLVRDRAEGEAVGQREADGGVGVFGRMQRKGQQQGGAECQQAFHGRNVFTTRSVSCRVR